VNAATTAHTVILGDEEARLGPTPVEQATARSLTADVWFRGLMVLVVCGIFIWLNMVVMTFVRDAFAFDSARIAATPPMPAADRLINANVVMALIGATVVQTGAGFIAVMSYLFPRHA
jgi:multisubunit Na+/H+ antiporter MnhB subunit